MASPHMHRLVSFLIKNNLALVTLIRSRGLTGGARLRYVTVERTRLQLKFANARP